MNADHLGNCLHCGKPVGTSGHCACRGILPESKPEPEKNCGNCGAGHTGCKTSHGKAYCGDWQPAPAEPQGWEQRLKAQFPDAYGEGPLMSFIRSEIERVREEEKQAVLKRIDQHYQSLGVQMVREDIEQNRHRSGK